MISNADKSAVEPGAWRSRLKERIRAARQGYRQVFGIPDYERYVAHRAAHHPGEPVLSPCDFHRAAIERKYGQGGGQRCC
jgi:uncharacterized short protein YbdD (DUF466 family)